MENASKALLIAGSILIALVIITLLIVSFRSISEFQNTQLTEEEQAQLIKFNEEYTKYIGKYVYGIEVRSLINKYEDDGMVQVIYDIEPPLGVGGETTYYKCESVNYNAMGKIDTITFKKVMPNQNT